MSKLSNMIGLAKKMLDSQTGQQQQGTPQGGPTGQRSWQSTLQDVAAAVRGDNQGAQAPGQGYPPAQQGYPTAPPVYPAAQQRRPSAPASTDADRQAIARYDYLMQTAEPHQIEQIHTESFARLTPAQREAVLQRMQTELPPNEQPRSADVADLSRAAARTEARRVRARGPDLRSRPTALGPGREVRPAQLLLRHAAEARGLPPGRSATPQPRQPSR